jgi:hypothetical protein
MLCKDCKYLKSKQVGHVSSRSWCNISKGNALKGTKMGIHPWSDKEHPKCPLKGGKYE